MITNFWDESADGQLKNIMPPSLNAGRGKQSDADDNDNIAI